jgi:hypothetical protein
MRLDKNDIFARLGNIQTIEGVRAIAPNVSAGVRSSGSVLDGRDLANTIDMRAFEKAGWIFVGPDKPCPAASAHDVVVDGDGHLKILAHALNVKFRPAASGSMVDDILARFSLSKRRAMGFSPNLFLVDDPSHNAISTAKALNQLDDVLYAEPVLIEAIGSR